MANLILNILSLGTKPLIEKQRKFHNLIVEFRHRFSNPQRASRALDDIKEFYEKLDNFDFNYVFFKDYYREYIENLNRFRPQDNNPDLTFIRIALTENKWKPTEPLPIFVHHLKYKNRLTSGFFISREKKLNLKKIKDTKVITEASSKSESDKKWTRIPIREEREKMLR